MLLTRVGLGVPALAHGSDALDESVPVVSRLLVYPIKSLEAHELERAALLPSGALEHDRSYALFTGDDVVTGKRHPAVHRLRASYDLGLGTVHLRDTRETALPATTFRLETEATVLEDWLGTFFGMRVALREDRETGFPDDPISPGPTIVSSASLRAIADWFGLPVAQTRARLRANVEIDDVPAFWEDRLFGKGDATVDFKVGTVRLAGVNPCARCVVPTRDPWTGTADRRFSHHFAERRRATLPDWAPEDRFDHYFRAAVNTRRADGVPGGVIKVGDELSIADAATAP